MESDDREIPFIPSFMSVVAWSQRTKEIRSYAMVPRTVFSLDDHAVRDFDRQASLSTKVSAKGFEYFRGLNSPSDPGTSSGH